MAKITDTGIDAGVDLKGVPERKKKERKHYKQIGVFLTPEEYVELQRKNIKVNRLVKDVIMGREVHIIYK